MSSPLYGELPEDLVDEVRATIDAIRDGSLGPSSHARVVDLIARMTDASFKHFFIAPLSDLDVGPTLRGLINVGLGSATKAVRMGLGRVLPKISAARWPRIADFLEAAVGAEA